MKLLIIFFTLTATIANFVAADHVYLDDYKQELEMQSEPTSLRGVSRRLVAQKNLLANLTCDKFARVCRQKMSPGPDCCEKKCVNVKTDRANCGMCRHKCKYTDICCRGQCINASFDKRHCGGCNNKCKKGEFCVYGMCNYA